MYKSINKIILATDFSDASKDASYHALQLAKTYRAELTALHTFDISMWKSPSSYYSTKEEYTVSVEHIEGKRKQGKEALKKLAESFDLDIKTIFTEGSPGQEIIRFAEEKNMDVIILGTHGYTGWKKFQMGSVSAFVVKHAPCSVFIIRPS